MQVVLGNMAAVIANRIRNIDGPVRTASLDCDIHQFAILVFAQMLFQIQMQGAAAIQILSHFGTVKHELINGFGRIFDNIEVAVIAITRYHKTIFLVPLGIFHTKIFSWHILGVEHDAIAFIGLVLIVDDLEHLIGEINIALIVRRNGITKELTALDIAVNTNRQELFIQGNISGIIDRQQFGLELILQNFVPCLEIHMNILDLFTNCITDITAIFNGSLD